MTPIIRIENLWHVYQSDTSTPIEALRGIDLHIHPGEYLVILGHNGSGKSTLAKHLNGLLLPTRGDVWVKSWNTKDDHHILDIRKTVGMVFQNPDNQIVATVVEEDVAFGPENLGVPHDELRRRVDWALDVVGMTAFRHRPPHLLSGGQKQRVAIAGIIAMRPEVLVLDESTALLDPVGRRDVLAIARRLNKEEGVTVVAITHFMEEAIFADRVVVLHKGQIVLEGTPREVFSQTERLRSLALDVPPVTEVAQALRSLRPDISPDVLTVPELVYALTGKLPPPVHERDPFAEVDTSHLPDTYTPLSPVPDDLSVEIRGLVHYYMRGTPLEVEALHGLDFDVGNEEKVAILGHTGSGKSTLIQHLNALLRPHKGRVRVLEYDLTQPKVDVRQLRRRVGLVFQFPEAQLFEKFVGDDVAYGPRQLGLSPEEIRERVRDAMNAVGLDFETYKDRYVFSLSGGEKRRAALAGILALRPEILVLDEPTAGLDPQGRRHLLSLIQRLKEEWHLTLVVVSHNMDEVAELADRGFVIADGRTITSGTPRDLFSRPQVLYDLSLGIPQVTQLMHALADAGMPVRRDCLTVDEAVQEIGRVLQEGVH
ncbi:MAG: energy-coupling factor transporter ATPase [Chloroflexi bacterium]|nr:energy-coupling factor transporter ATPase [Chloroflexota bacterium]